MRARLIAVPVPEEVAVMDDSPHDLCQWTIVLTIPQEELNVQEALVLLRLRWQVELLFKLWKQVGHADESRSATFSDLLDCHEGVIKSDPYRGSTSPGQINFNNLLRRAVKCHIQYIDDMHDAHGGTYTL